MPAEHIYPVGDLLQHELEGSECACQPVLEPVELEHGDLLWLILHNAWDGRP